MGVQIKCKKCCKLFDSTEEPPQILRGIVMCKDCADKEPK